MTIIRSSLSAEGATHPALLDDNIGGNLKVNNRYQEMSGIMINESFNGLVKSPASRGMEDKQ